MRVDGPYMADCTMSICQNVIPSRAYIANRSFARYEHHTRLSNPKGKAKGKIKIKIFLEPKQHPACHKNKKANLSRDPQAGTLKCDDRTCRS